MCTLWGISSVVCGANLSSQAQSGRWQLPRRFSHSHEGSGWWSRCASRDMSEINNQQKNTNAEIKVKAEEATLDNIDGADWGDEENPIDI